MARKVRVEDEGAIDHLINRGDRREDIFGDDRDRRRFLETLEEACQKTSWEVHAYCLMRNHFHLVVATPRANLCAGRHGLLGTYTARFNRRHHLFGHLFSGRYKSLLVDGSGQKIAESVEREAERLMADMMRAFNWVEKDLQEHCKGDRCKGRIAAALRSRTTVSWKWIAEKLRMGHWRSAANAVRTRR